MQNDVEERQFEMGEYCVMYLDIMGQKKFLSELEKCDEHEARQMIARLSKPLLRFKEGMSQRACEVIDVIRETVKQNIKGESCRNEFLMTLDNISYGVQQFSDTTLLYVKMEKNIPMAFLVVQAFVEFVVFRMLDDMANGFVLRGGISIGKGWEVERNCLCGQVLADAYNLEEKVAKWGRIVVSELFATRLRGICGFAALMGGCGFVKLLRPLIGIVNKDVDGMEFIDYLNPSSEEMYKRHHFASEWFVDRIEKGMAFIENERKRCYDKASRDFESAKLAMRYDIMYRYWRSRLLMWNKRKVCDK